MTREYQRIPYSVRVQFRTASSFLVAYSLNLSRGGLFVETDHAFAVGTEVSLQFAVPGTGPLMVRGKVTWVRSESGEAGPPGMGIEFDDVSDAIGPVIDSLISTYEGVNVVVICSDDSDRERLTRILRTIISSAEVVGAADAAVAESLFGSDVDLVVIDLDSNSDEALAAVVVAKSQEIPTIALSSQDELRERAREVGASEVTTNPPPSSEFQRLIIRAIGRPTTVRGDHNGT